MQGVSEAGAAPPQPSTPTRPMGHGGQLSTRAARASSSSNGNSMPGSPFSPTVELAQATAGGARGEAHRANSRQYFKQQQQQQSRLQLRSQAVFRAMEKLLVEGAVSEEELWVVARVLSGDEFLQVAEERGAAGLCGNPLCARPAPPHPAFSPYCSIECGHAAAVFATHLGSHGAAQQRFEMLLRQEQRLQAVAAAAAAAAAVAAGAQQTHSGGSCSAGMPAAALAGSAGAAETPAAAEAAEGPMAGPGAAPMERAGTIRPPISAFAAAAQRAFSVELPALPELFASAPTVPSSEQLGSAPTPASSPMTPSSCSPQSALSMEDLASAPTVPAATPLHLPRVRFSCTPEDR